MNGDTTSLVQLLLNFIYEKPKVASINASKVPADTWSAVKQWGESRNIPIDDASTSLTITLISVQESHTYLYDYSGDDPELFRAVCVAQGKEVIGDSIIVGD